MHGSNLPFNCDHCTYRFTTEARLRNHEKSKHFKEEIKFNLDSFSCENCRLQFDDKNCLINHLRETHHDLNLCEFCCQTFSTHKILIRHYSRLHNDDLKHECEECGRKFINQLFLLRHSSRCHGRRIEVLPKVEEVPVNDVCKFCNQNFHTRYKLERHLIIMHEDKQAATLECDICSKKFIFMNSLREHITMHSRRWTEQGRPIKCDYEGCNRRFASEENMKNHL